MSEVPSGRDAPSDERHTPGPWHWDSDPIKGAPNRVRFRVCAKGRTITQCYYPSGDGYAEADTRLIAAAPDMLEALTELMTMLRKEAPGTPLNNHRFDALGIKAYAALAKAQGR